MDSLQVTDSQAAACAVAPRVSIADIEAAISSVDYMTAGEAIDALAAARVVDPGAPAPAQLAANAPQHLMTLAIVTLRNGFVVIGTSAAASPANYNAELGRKFAREHAIRQLWPLMGFHLRSQLHLGAGEPTGPGPA